MVSGDDVTIKYFRATTGEDGGGEANAGRGKLALTPSQSAGPPLLRLACRDVQSHSGSEQDMLARLNDAVAAAGFGFSRALVVTYYVSLKTNPFVILTGALGGGKTEFVRHFAEALIGRNSSQYALIAGGAWPSGTGRSPSASCARAA